jgi:small subunit ribosomal protein S6
MLLTGADLEAEARSTIIERAKDAVAKGGGTWKNIDDWGRRTMTYEILKQRDAHYSLLEFESDGPTVDEVVRVLRITDGVLRVMAVNKPQARPEGVPLELVTEADLAEREERPRGRGRGGGGGGRGRDRDR